MPIAANNRATPIPQTFSLDAARSDHLNSYSSIVARARRGSILVRRSPSARSHAKRLTQRRLGRARLPLVFLVHASGTTARVWLGRDFDHASLIALPSLHEQLLFWLFRSHHGVFLFFVLSGFLIGRLWWPRQ